MKNRQYQDDADFSLTKAVLEGHHGIVVVMPTGAGKTVWFANQARRMVVQGRKVMIGANRLELVTQAEEKLKRMGVHPTLILPGHKIVENECYVASIETLHRRIAKNQMPYVDVLVLDEIHIQQHDKIIKAYRQLNPRCLIIGVTATPIRPKKYPLSDLFSKMIVVCTTQNLVDWGYLVENCTWRATTEVGETAKMKGDDFDQEEAFKILDRPKLYNGVLENYTKNANGMKNICFNSNIKHSEKMTQYCRDNGIEAYHIDGNTNKYDRDRIVANYKAGKFLWLNNCHIFTTGFDDPGIQAVTCNFMTVSLPKWLQANGRGSRANIDLSPYNTPEERKAAIAASNKPKFITLDHGDNYPRLGHWISDREWDLEPPKKKIDVGGVAPIRECLDCGCMIPMQARVCPSCGVEAPIVEKTLANAENFILAAPRKLPEHLNKKFTEMSVAELEERRLFGDAVGKPLKVGWLIVMLKEKAKIASAATRESSYVSADDFLDKYVDEYMDIMGHHSGWKKYQNLKIDTFDVNKPIENTMTLDAIKAKMKKPA